MGTANEYFDFEEFGCKCGKCKYTDGYDIHPILPDIAYAIRVALNRKIIINSGIRCEKHNKDVGGAYLSYHLVTQGCRAFDFSLKKGHEVYERYTINRICVSYSASIGFYDTFCHIDVRPIPVVFIGK